MLRRMRKAHYKIGVFTNLRSLCKLDFLRADKQQYLVIAIPREMGFALQAKNSWHAR
jgi:hypothetical protein